jgi:hypothetical protein
MAANENFLNANSTANNVSQIFERISLLEAEQQQQQLQPQQQQQQQIHQQISGANCIIKPKKPRHRKTKCQKSNSNVTTNIISEQIANNNSHHYIQQQQAQQQQQHHHNNYHHHHQNNQHQQHPLHHRAHHHSHRPHQHPAEHQPTPHVAQLRQSNDLNPNRSKNINKNHTKSDLIKQREKITTTKIYEPYYDPIRVHDGISKSEIVQGKLRINQRSFEDAFITDPVLHTLLFFFFNIFIIICLIIYLLYNHCLFIATRL